MTILDDITSNFNPFYLENALFLNKEKIKALKNNFDDNYLNTKITEIYNIVMPILSSYQLLHKKNNLNLHICLLLNKYVFFIYATYTIFYDIKTNKITSIKNIVRKYNYEILNIQKPFNKILPYLLHFSTKYLDNIDYNPHYKVPNNPLDIITSKKTMIEYIKYYIYHINNTIFIKPNINNNYITIPQYKNICWFVSMITGIAYSDMSKNLLLSNKKARFNNKYQAFNDFIFYIIDNITKNHKTYNENFSKDCEILKVLKKQPTKVITSLIINYTKYNENKCITSLLNIIKLAITDNFSKKIKYYRNKIVNKYDFNYFLCKFISHLPLNIFTDFIQVLNIKNINDFNNKKKILKTLLKIKIKDYYDKFKISTIYGSYSREIDIISFFYDILHIKNLCCKCYKVDDIISTNYIKGDTISPDIILLEFINNPNNIKKNDINITININININSKEIIFNGNKYKLDYIINSSNDILSCNTCGHTISAIHYNKQQYFYNTSNEINLIKCNGNDNENDNGNDKIYIPCFLIKNNWTKKIFTNVNYKLQKCSYIEINPLNISQKDNIIEENLYYNFSSDIVYVYVKI
jgi:hypothetical protein